MADPRGNRDPSYTLDPKDLAIRVEKALGKPPLYAPDFTLVTEENEILRGRDATSRLEERGVEPVINAALGSRSGGGFLLVYERISSAIRFDEPWPAPAASVIELDSDLRVIERRDYGGFIRG